ncbi:hypothetical protein GE061_004596 [Apolygus lucorum]|uniref:Peptidase M20 dimerisation domain-containing protein n=1 Tax=Apolygus lucorum TaxID=248454 RepID=A0A8S9X1F0_APOLU|nr:hypothetical protein GE061_004596 [Apolygus lucorum]
MICVILYPWIRRSPCVTSTSSIRLRKFCSRSIRTLVDSIVPLKPSPEFFKMSAVPEELGKIFQYVDKNKERFIERLRDVVRIPSVSSAPDKRDDVIAMVRVTEEKLKKLGAKTELCDVGTQKLSDGRTLRLPPVILAKLGDDPSKPTVLVYGHLDVQPAAKEDGWNTEPFDLTLSCDGKKLYGRGASDDKGPVMCWLNAIESYQNCDIDLPTNLKFVFEGMEESGSEGLEELLEAKRDSFFKGIHYVCISDNYWLGTRKPCLTYGLRGICYFFIEIECAVKDLHSGLYGGVLNEATSDLIHVLDSLLDRQGKIKIPDLQNDVLPVTDEEKELYKNIDFNVSEFKTEIGTNQLLHNEDKAKILMSRWRFPSLSIHGIEGAFAEEGSKTVIPRKVVGKFSIRIVPNMEPQKVEESVVKYLTSVWNKRGSNNKFKVYMTHGAKSWVSDVNHTNYTAARAAVRHVFNVEPDLTREGGSIPITINLEDVTGTNVILIPIGCCDDGAHSQNEKIDVLNYIEGSKLLAAYLYEIGNQHQKS